MKRALSIVTRLSVTSCPSCVTSCLSCVTSYLSCVTSYPSSVTISFVMHCCILHRWLNFTFAWWKLQRTSAKLHSLLRNHTVWISTGCHHTNYTIRDVHFYFFIHCLLRLVECPYDWKLLEELEYSRALLDAPTSLWVIPLDIFLIPFTTSTATELFFFTLTQSYSFHLPNLRLHVRIVHSIPQIIP